MAWSRRSLWNQCLILVFAFPVRTNFCQSREGAASGEFDVTPHRYVTGIGTEAGIVYPPFVKNLRAAVESGNTR